MGRSWKLPLGAAFALCLLLTSSCGAGLITGIATSGDNGAGTPPPALGLSATLPLKPAPDSTRSVLVANAKIAATASLRVRLEIDGAGDDQLNAIASGQGGSTSITFTLVTTQIQARVGDLTLADVPGKLLVFVDEQRLGEPLPVVLARQPRAELQLDLGQTERSLSPFGERVLVRVEGLRSTAASNLELLVTTRDPATAPTATDPEPVVVRRATDVQFELPVGGVPVLSAFVPGSAFPLAAEIVVRDPLAGESTKVTNVFYRPDVALALPSQGPSTGGSLLTLIGTALVPPDFTAGTAPAPLAFEDVQLVLEKGGRITPLPREDLRPAESASDRLVFTMPPSPDGRPGQVDIVLRVRIGARTAQVVASQVFLFANPDPFFGPRGIVLDRLPVAVAPIALDQAPSTAAAPDFAALTEQGGVAFLQLVLAQQNGMFQEFAAPRQLGDPEVAEERGPRDLCVGDFDGDAVPDVFVANEGAAMAVHHLVLGQRAPAAPLGAVYEFLAAGGSYRCRAAFFDADTIPDLLLVPGPAAGVGQRPQVLLARPTGVGAPAFALPIDVPVRDFPYEAIEVADLDGDGVLDVAVVSGTLGKLDVAYGLGNGNFSEGVPLDFTVPGYTFAGASTAVGLHACQDSVTQSLGLVLAGALPLGPTSPTVTVLRVAAPSTAPRVYEPPQPVRTIALPTEPIGKSIVTDLDGVPPVEMVLAMAGEPTVISLGVMQLGPLGGFLPLLGTIEGAILPGTESPRQVRALVFDRAFPTTATSPGRNAVFLVHETEIDGAREKRLSTRLVIPSTPEPVLLPPDAGAQPGYRIVGIIGGDFHPTSIAGAGQVRDLALARQFGTAAPDSVQLVENDGFGGFPRLSNFLPVPGLLAGSLAVLPAAGTLADGLLFVDGTSRVGFWRHEPPVVVPPQEPPPPTAQTVDAWIGELRALLPAPLASTALAEGTRLLVGDVDGDGVKDLVALLTFALPAPGEGQAAIALLRGKPAFAENEFPFHEPTQLALVHGNASTIVLGDFANTGPGQPVRLELAVAVPVGTGSGIDGDHVRFFRYQPGPSPGDDRFVPAAVGGGPQVLLAGSNPVQLAATDFDRDGLVDLLVACRGDESLRLFRNTSTVDPLRFGVLVDAFEEANSSPWSLTPGLPTRLQLSDVNGDGNLDAVAFVETVVGTGPRSTSVRIYLSAGDGSFEGPRDLSPTRIGNRDGRLVGDLGDWNRDGLPDLFLGWDNTAEAFTFRVLFGGTK